MTDKELPNGVKNRRVPNMPLGPAWVHQEPFWVPGHPGTPHPFDRRRQAATHHPFERVFDYWCQENHRGKRCNTFLGALYATSEGLVWEAWIEEPPNLDLRDFYPERYDKKVPDELHTLSNGLTKATIR